MVKITSNQGENIIHEYTHTHTHTHTWSSQVVKNPSANSGAAGTAGLIAESERSSGKGNGKPLEYSSQDNPVGKGAWQAIVHGVAEFDTTEVTELVCTYIYVKVKVPQSFSEVL